MNKNSYRIFFIRTTIMIMVFMTFTGYLFSQDAPKKANTINICDTTGNYTGFYKSIVKVLFKEKFSFENQDPEMEVISTFPKTIYLGWLKNEEATMVIRILFEKDGKITRAKITGDYFVKEYSMERTPIANRGMSGSSAKDIWEELVRIAKLFPSSCFDFEKVDP